MAKEHLNDETKQKIKGKLESLLLDVDLFSDPNWYGGDDEYEASRENIEEIAELLGITLEPLIREDEEDEEIL